jgi:tetratricopeptide (TPR) repeat protein
MSRNLRLLLTFLVCTFLGLAPQLQPLALAQDEPEEPDAAEDDDEEDEEEQAAKHFAAGRKLKAEGKKKEAVEELLKAYKLRPAPPLLLYIAQVYQSMDDKKSALKYYKEYLQKARFSDPQRPMVQGEVKKLEKQVTGSTGAITSAAGTETPEAAGGDPDGATSMTRRRKLQMIHTPIDSAKVRTAITVMAEMPPRLEVDAVTLHFRKGGEIKFRERKMELQGESYIAQIPARYVTSTSLQYYITARKGTGKRSIVAEAGAKNAPHIVVIEGGRSPTLGPVKEEAITSPYRTWIWVSGAVAVAMIGVGAVGLALSADRQAAMEKWVREKSCKTNCPPPSLLFSDKARDWESEGQSFNALGIAGLIVGGVAAGATGFLWYMDRKYIKEERTRRDADAGSLRLIAAPWVGEGGAGIVGKISF